MTILLEPSLLLRRLVVTSSGKRIFDHLFKAGPNIIWGQNGSGKSTILDLLRFSLGSEIPEKEWSNAALRCDFTFAEVLINGSPATLRRQVSGLRTPLAIYWGAFDTADSSAAEGWEVFPYAAQGARLSFSQVLFQALGLPEVRNPELRSRITMHQVLRLLCADQRTPYDQIFIDEEWDSPLTRDAVGDLLLGVYDEKLYDGLVELRRVEDELVDIRSQVRALETVFAATGVDPTVQIVEAQISSLSAELEGIQNKLLRASDIGSTVEADTKPESASIEVDRLRRRLEGVRSELGDQLDRAEALQYEIQDSRLFLESLTQRMDALDDSEKTREVLGAAAFRYCPACYSPFEIEKEGHCIVCQRPLSDQATTNLLLLRHQLVMQHDESEQLQRGRHSAHADLRKQIRATKTKLKTLQAQYNVLHGMAVTESERERAGLHRASGYIERQLEDLQKKRNAAARLQELTAKRDALLVSKERLEDDTRRRKSSTYERKQDVTDKVSEVVLHFLHHDLPREPAFEKASRASFDFSKNVVEVDGRSNFAASSMIYLRDSFRIALLIVSLHLPFMRHPRFTLIDNLEDKGMEVERNHNLQRLIIKKSQEAETLHQIIFSTSYLAPEFTDSELLVGQYYTRQNQTLNFSGEEVQELLDQQDGTGAGS